MRITRHHELLNLPNTVYLRINKVPWHNYSDHVTKLSVRKLRNEPHSCSFTTSAAVSVELKELIWCWSDDNWSDVLSADASHPMLSFWCCWCAADRTLTVSVYKLWSPYGIGKAIIFLSCSFFFLSISLSSFFFPRLFSAVADWTSTIFPHMVWP